MDYLNDLGFSDTDVEDILNNNYQYVIDNLALNKNNVIDIVRYLLQIGVEKTSVKDIFVYQISLFFKTKEEIESTFDEYELDSIVKSLNFDANNVELIDFI